MVAAKSRARAAWTRSTLRQATLRVVVGDQDPVSRGARLPRLNAWWCSSMPTPPFWFTRDTMAICPTSMDGISLEVMGATVHNRDPIRCWGVQLVNGPVPTSTKVPYRRESLEVIGADRVRSVSR